MIESLILYTNNIVNNLLNRIIISDSPSIQGIVFYNRNTAIHAKIIAL